MNDDFYNNLSNRITTSTNKNDDRFVGVCYKNDRLLITSPMGFDITKPNVDNIKFRDDLKLLLFTIKKYYQLRNNDDINSSTENSILKNGNKESNTNFPVYSYDYIIKDFINNGYCIEKEIVYKESDNGKIHWGRTIKQEKKYIDNDNIFFLKFIRRKSNILDNELITLLHKTCVYESFTKWGFIYFDNYEKIGEKPKIKIEDAKKYIGFLHEKLSKTFSDKNKQLFTHMINVINFTATFSDKEEYRYGVEFFHPIWEKMIDEVFGVDSKEKVKFYPSAMWHLIDGEEFNASNLRPDTIMNSENNVYVLDAKYYGKDDGGEHRFPASSDVNKQITYGKYVEDVSGKEPYNAFLIPSDVKEVFKYIGYADLNEVIKSKSKKYARVSTICVNTRYLMSLRYSKADSELKKLLVDEIHKAIDYKEDTNIIEFSKKFDQFKNVCEYNKLAAHIDLTIFTNIYDKIGAVIDKFIQDNKK